MNGSVLAMLNESASRDSDTPRANAIAMTRPRPVTRESVVPTAMTSAGRARLCLATSNVPVSGGRSAAPSVAAGSTWAAGRSVVAASS